MDIKTILRSVGISPCGESNKNIFIKCPFHDDSRPSLSIKKSDGKWICGGCKRKGDFNKFLLLLQTANVDVSKVDHSSDVFTGVPVEEDQEKEIDLEEAKRLIKLCYDYYAEDYLSSRNITEEFAMKLGLGYNPENKRVIIPAYGLMSDFLGVTSRSVVNEKPKYVHTHFIKYIPFHSVYHSTDFHFNYKIPDRVKYDAILVEGSFDAFNILKFMGDIESENHFITNIGKIITVFGSNLTDSLSRYLGTYLNSFIVCFDNDEPGRKGEISAAEKLLPFGPVWTVGNKPKEKDVGDYEEVDFNQLSLLSYPF
jgi:DNA primase